MDLLSEPMTQKIPPRTLFSQAWATVLRPRYAELIKTFYYTPRIRFQAGDEPEIAINFLTAIHERNLILLNNQAEAGGFLTNPVWRIYVRRGSRWMKRCKRRWKSFSTRALEGNNVQLFVNQNQAARLLDRLNRFFLGAFWRTAELDAGGEVLVLIQEPNERCALHGVIHVLRN